MTPSLYDLNSASGLRQIVAALFQGYNYRLYTEGETRSVLLDAYQQLSELQRRLPDNAGFEEWIEAVRDELGQAGNDLAWWVLGLTNKTAVNLGIRRDERFIYLEEMAQHIKAAVENAPALSFNDAMLMIWAGAATLTVRGSRKSTAGKTLEGAFLRAGLSILGLEEDTDFWMNMPADDEVRRETDVEISSRRGRIRVEMGLIGQGNQEVIDDKINRVGAGGMVIFDYIGPKSKTWQNAKDQQVCFIQIRNNQPLTEMYDYLKDRVGKTLVAPPTDTTDIVTAVNKLPDNIFVPE